MAFAPISLCQSLDFCVAFRGSHDRPWGWADAVINTPKKHLFCGPRGRERTLKQQETVRKFTFLYRSWYYWSQRSWILSGKTDRTPQLCCVFRALQVFPLISLQITQFHYEFLVWERISSFYLCELSYNSFFSISNPWNNCGNPCFQTFY